MNPPSASWIRWFAGVMPPTLIPIESRSGAAPSEPVTTSHQGSSRSRPCRCRTDFLPMVPGSTVRVRVRSDPLHGRDLGPRSPGNLDLRLVRHKRLSVPRAGILGAGYAPLQEVAFRVVELVKRREPRASQRVAMRGDLLGGRCRPFCGG